MNFPFYENAPKEVVTECNLCGSRRYVLVSTVDRYKLDAPTAKCEDCGLIFLSHRMTAEAYREFYEAGHYRELLNTFFKKSVTPEVIESDQNRYAKMLSRWLTPHMNGNRSGLLLDLGGSTGNVAARLALDFDMDATVVESSAREAERARDKGLAVAQVRLEDYEAGGNHYDLILLCRTVDHLLDIKAALAKIRGWLAPSGLFFVDFVIGGKVKIDHPYYLSTRTMRRYLEQAGFRVKRLQTSPDALGFGMGYQHANVLCEGA